MMTGSDTYKVRRQYKTTAISPILFFLLLSYITASCHSRHVPPPSFPRLSTQQPCPPGERVCHPETLEARVIYRFSFSLSGRGQYTITSFFNHLTSQLVPPSPHYTRWHVCRWTPELGAFTFFNSSIGWRITFADARAINTTTVRRLFFFRFTFPFPPLDDVHNGAEGKCAKNQADDVIKRLRITRWSF